MGKERIIAASNGVVQRLQYHEGTGKHVLRTTCDLSPLVDYAKGQFNQVDERARWGDGQHVAHIPAVVWAQFVKEGKHTDRAFIKSWLNDPDNRAFRTRPGRI